MKSASRALIFVVARDASGYAGRNVSRALLREDRAHAVFGFGIAWLLEMQAEPATNLIGVLVGIAALRRCGSTIAGELTAIVGVVVGLILATS